MVKIRRPVEADADEWVAVGHQLDRETKFMMLEPGERTLTAEQMRNRHMACIWIGVLQAYAGRGVGTRLFEALEAWARENGLHRLELTVMAHNAAGVALYRKMGFEIEGARRDSLRVDGAWVDEYAMAKLLN
ncbi:MAG TPA: GNAT family N-acetyltransferase [Symbiobacteriaceae bacterium]|nr:GNAT family N-acetyltransferase [Symbiobacteriaceae bacterium]